MDTATFEVLERILSPLGAPRIEYWHGPPDTGGWRAERPGVDARRVDALVHESSTLVTASHPATQPPSHRGHSRRQVTPIPRSHGRSPRAGHAPLPAPQGHSPPAGHTPPASRARKHPSRRHEVTARGAGEVITLAGLPQVLWPTHCVRGSRGAALVEALDQRLIAALFPKGCDPEIDSYSGFFDNGGRRSTGLGEFLQARGVDEVFVLGLATDYCVKFTALDAARSGSFGLKKVRLVVDGCRAVELRPGDGAAALAAMSAAGVELIDAATALALARGEG
ncbi:MAG: isochorismatase family protein [Nannocystis sp.]|nr:isochorismatase family protein [Nannocystis sp.]